MGLMRSPCACPDIDVARTERPRMKATDRGRMAAAPKSPVASPSFGSKMYNRDDEAVIVARVNRLRLEFLLVLQAELLVLRSHGCSFRGAAVEVALGGPGKIQPLAISNRLLERGISRD